MTEAICVFGPKYQQETPNAITATKYGRYINLTKYGETDKEFRYDIQTGKFERINHYKKGDKITPVKTRNITRWFTDCSIFCEDPKFAKLMIANKYHGDNCQFSSGVRFIEALNSTFSRNYEAWLSIGLDITDIRTRVEECIQDDNKFYYKPHFWQRIHVTPQEMNKSVLKFLTDNYKEVTLDQINEFKRMENTDTLMTLLTYSQDEQYEEIFSYTWSTYHYETGRVYHTGNLFDLSKELDYNASRIRSNILEAIHKYNLDIPSFFAFLLRAYNVEGLTLNDLFSSSHYNDYLKMEKLLKKGKMSKIVKYPRQFLTQFHIIKREYEACKKEYDQVLFKEQCDNFRYLEKKYNKYQIIVPEQINEIENEADELRHCVRTYIDRVIAGKTLICFLRTNENPEQPLVTIEVKNDKITQAYGKRDKKPEDEELAVIRQWAKDKKLALAWVWRNYD